MQGRPRNPNEWRGYNSNYRNYNRGGGGGSFGRKSFVPPSPPPPPRRKEEILTEAGRLAAEYLVYKGLLPPESLPPKWQNRKFQDFKGQERQALVPDGRNLPFNRHGNLNVDVGNVRRRYNDEYNDGMRSRNDLRGKRRMGEYSREYGPDWGRESRGYNNLKDEDDFPHGYYKERQSGFDQLPSRSENTVESGSENHIPEDTGSKASSSGARREGEMNKDMADDDNGIYLEGGDEVKSDASDNSKKKNVEEELHVKLGKVEGESLSDGVDSMQLCNSARETTMLHLSVDEKSPKMERGITAGGSDVVEDSSGEPMVTLGEDKNNSLTNQTDIKRQASETLNHLSVQPVVESIGKQDQTERNDERVGVKRQRDSSLEYELSQMRSVREKQSSPEVEKPLLEEEIQTELVGGVPMDEETVGEAAIEQEKVEVEPEINDKKEEEKELLPASFKTCDLNLMQGPEVTEIHDDPDPEHDHASVRKPETGKELSMDFSLSIGNNSNGADDFGRVSSDDKVVQVIDLESDLAIDASASDPSKPKDEPIYPNLDAFLNQPEHGDIPGLNDGYSLAFSEFLPSDLNNLQAGMGLHGAEGVPNDDDSIYVSLGEIPISFMEVWDQPHQEYEKFF